MLDVPNPRPGSSCGLAAGGGRGGVKGLIASMSRKASCGQSSQDLWTA